MDSILIAIPAYNAESSLSGMIAQLRYYLSNLVSFDIMVVDDGSSDQTSSIAKSLGVLLIHHQRNLGKGAALKTAFQYALQKDYQAVVTIDSDLQHDPASLPSMLECYKTESYDLLIGARTFDSKKMSLSRILSNYITSKLISFRTKQTIPDSQSGYRIIKTKTLRDLILKTSRFETESEILIRLAQKNCTIGFYPIDTIYAGEKSNIRHIEDTIRFIKMYISTFFD